MCLTIFFFPYALFEVPSNVVLKILRPSVWLTIIVLAWGTVMTLSGIVQNYSGLLAARFFLGVTEVIFTHNLILTASLLTNSIGWIVPRCRIHPYDMVSSPRNAESFRCLLLRCNLSRCLFWSASFCTRKDGWYRRSRGLEMVSTTFFHVCLVITLTYLGFLSSRAWPLSLLGSYSHLSCRTVQIGQSL